MAGASFTPDLIWEDAYFDEDRPLSRRERVLWIAKNILRSDNCVAKRGEGAWSLRYLSEAWKCPKTTVERFLKKLENLGVIAIRKCKINGTVQYVISYLFSTLSAFSTKVTGTASGTGAGQERDKKKSRESEDKDSDSCAKQAPHEPVKGWKIPDTEEVLRATTEPSSPASEAAEPSPAPEEARARPSRKSPAGYSPEFEALWSAFPEAARRGSKAAVHDKWLKMSPEIRAACLVGAKRWAENAKGKEPKFIAMAQTWVNQKRWETEREPVVKQPSKNMADFCTW